MVQVLRKMPSDGGAATAKCQMLAAILQTWLVQAQHELTNMVEESTSPSTALWPWPWRKEILFLLKLWNSFLGVNCGDNLQSGRMQWQWLMTRLAERGRVAKLPSYDISSRFEKSKWRPWRPFHAEESDACQQSGSNAEDDGVFSCCLLGTGTRHKICQECQAIATKRSRSQDH